MYVNLVYIYVYICVYPMSFAICWYNLATQLRCCYTLTCFVLAAARLHPASRPIEGVGLILFLAGHKLHSKK